MVDAAHSSNSVCFCVTISNCELGPNEEERACTRSPKTHAASVREYGRKLPSTDDDWLIEEVSGGGSGLRTRARTIQRR